MVRYGRLFELYFILHFILSLASSPIFVCTNTLFSAASDFRPQKIMELKSQQTFKLREEENKNLAVTRIAEIDDPEQRKVALMRAFVEKHDPSSKEVDDLCLRRFLRARDLDIEKASAMFLKYLKWRHSFIPENSFSASDIPNELAQKKLFLQGYDKVGRPITVAFGGKHCPNKKGIEEFKRFVVFSLEKICSRIPAGEEKFVVIGDLKGWGYTSCDIRAYLGALTILQDYYPERLGKLFIVNVPYIFMTVWKAVYPFIDDNTKKKITFVENKKQKSTLLEEIDEDQLPEIYGGKLPLIPIED